MSAQERLSIAFLVTALCAGCSEPTMEAPRTIHSAPVVFGLSASEVVDALQAAGTVVLHPIDTTSADCPSAGCSQAITTDRFRVLSFDATGAAQTYAADHGMEQVENVVVAFAPPVPNDERDKIWVAITKALR